MGMQIDFDVVRTACVHFLPACQSVAHTNTKSLWNEFVAITLVLEMAEKNGNFSRDANCFLQTNPTEI